MPPSALDDASRRAFELARLEGRAYAVFLPAPNEAYVVLSYRPGDEHLAGFVLMREPDQGAPHAS